MITVDGYADAMAVLKHPDMAQALYDAGGAVMGDALITLHGGEHTRRRVTEFSVFGRGFFRHYEREVFPRTLAPVLAPFLESRRADLVELGYRVTMNLTADFAGIDRLADDAEETETLLALVRAFSTGATVVHSTLDPDAVNKQVDAAMTLFSERFVTPSVARRQALLERGATLPNDVLSTLLEHADTLPLGNDVLRREMAFYLQAGAHSTANSMVHAMHELFTWMAADDGVRAALVAEPARLQRAVHESLRLHPASPVALRRATRATEVAGHGVAEGELVRVDLERANRDARVFGADAETFDPERQLPDGTWPFGLTFGYGTHACLGRDLDGGVVPRTGADPGALQLGIVPGLVRTLLQHGATPIEDEAPSLDETTTRNNFSTYPVVFAGGPAS